MINWLYKLNEQQLKAVKYLDTPLRIIAGAGAGKTRVITTKIAYLINEVGIKPSRILAVTFTNKAAKEMRMRVQDMLPEISSKPFIATFHALCVRILREDGEYIDLAPDFSIVDTDDQYKIVQNILRNINNEDDPKNIRGEIKKIINSISTWKNDFMSSGELKGNVYGDKMKALNVYEKYEQELKRINATDFDGLLINVHKLFNEYKDVRLKWVNRFDYIVVDEFQDTNSIQFDLIKWLVNNRNNLTVVGDPDQTIYSWRGAKVQLIMNFAKSFKDAHTILLNENYRSTQYILNLANDFIKHNDERESKDIFTNNIGGEKPILGKAFDQISEAKWVVSHIKDLIKQGYSYRDVFILYRTNSWSRLIENELKYANIAYNVRGGMQFRNRKVIKDVTSMLRAVVFKDELAMERILDWTPKIGDVTIGKIKSAALIANMNIVDFIASDDIILITKYASDLQKALINSFKDYRDNNDLVTFAKKVIEHFNYVDIELRTKSQDIESDLLNIGAYYDQMSEFVSSLDETYNGNPIVDFLQTESLGITDNVETDNAVTLLTIHSAKGLENKIVFLMGLNRGIFPSRMSFASKQQLEEERRALYVAITRAEKKLFISFVDGEYSAQIGEYLSQSKFVEELNQEYLNIEDNVNLITDNSPHTANSSYTKGDLSNTTKSDYILKQRVKHLLFGNGIVIKIEGNVTTIAFDNPAYGVKTFIGKTSAIEVIDN